MQMDPEASSAHPQGPYFRHSELRPDIMDTRLRDDDHALVYGGNSWDAQHQGGIDVVRTGSFTTAPAVPHRRKRFRKRYIAVIGLIGLVALTFIIVSVLRKGHDATPDAPAPALDIPISAGQLTVYCESMAENVDQELEKLELGLPFTKILAAFNRIDRYSSNAGSVSSLMAAVNPEADARDAASECAQKIEAKMSSVATNQTLFQIFDQGFRSVPQGALDANTQRYADKRNQSFYLAGVDKPESVRTTLNALSSDITVLSDQFAENVQEDRKTLTVARSDAAMLAGLPQDYIDARTNEANTTVTISTDYTDYYPVMTYAQSRDLRLQLFRLFLQRGYPANLPILADVLKKRQEFANLLGYQSWANYSMVTMMAGDPDNVNSFLEDIATAARTRRQPEIDELSQYLPAAANGTLQAYDTSFAMDAARQAKFDVDSKIVRSFFTFEKAKMGVMSTARRLFGVEFEEITDASSITWHSDVQAYYVYNTRVSGRPRIGRIFLDMFPRDGKYKHAAQFEIRAGVENEQLAEGCLVCNFPKKGAMEHSQVVTFFHEFGHLMHEVVGGQGKQFASFSGVATEWDFVEAPSQMLENWAWDTETLQSFATNSSGHVIPTSLVERMVEAEDFGVGISVSQQIFYAMVSLKFHTSDANTLNTTDMVQQLQAQYSPYPYVPDTYFQASFGHLMGYSSNYYTYQWSLVIAKDLFTRFSEKGLFDAVVAGDYTTKVLRPGGTLPAAELVKNYLNRPYSFEPYMKWLTQQN